MNGFANDLDLQNWALSTQEVAINKVLANISPPDGQPGSVLASPQRANPNYYFHWVRDGARTMRALVYLYDTHDARQQQIAAILQDYVEFSKIQQVTPTMCGTLGEPKFYVTGQDYDGPWGRPQNDGPAQRALVLTRWANQLITDGHKQYVTSILYDGKLPTYSVIKADLEFVAHHWGESCFDLWEEVNGTHFFTRMHQRAALREGAALAITLNDPGAAAYYNLQADAIESQMGLFWPGNPSCIDATINQVGGLPGKNSGLDSSVVLGPVETYYDEFPQYYPPHDERVLASAFALCEAFRKLYPINQTTTTPTGAAMFPAIGRYPEDTYNGSDARGVGNPWYLCTLSMGGLCYKAAELILTDGKVEITILNQPYLSLAVALVQPGITLTVGQTLSTGSTSFVWTVRGLVAMGDAYLRRVRSCTPADGSMSEQFDRATGQPMSACDLTWSYVALALVVEWRSEAIAIVP